MGRYTVWLTLIIASVILAIGRPISADEPAVFLLKKECVVFGHTRGVDVKLYPIELVPGTEDRFKDMTRIKGFEILNVTTGEWHPLTLSKEGCFCANVGMGQHDLRGRDSEGRPYLIHRFNVPLNMAVNLGTFRVETCDPAFFARERWYNYFRTAGWKMFREGDGQIAARLKRDTSRDAYEDCENWLAGCHEEVYEHFESVMARR